MSERPPRYSVITGEPREFTIEAPKGAGHHTFRASVDGSRDRFAVWLAGSTMPVIVEGQGVRDLVKDGVPEVVAVWTIATHSSHKPAASIGFAVSPAIGAALSAMEWADVKKYHDGLMLSICLVWGQVRPDAALAIANDALPDSDPRKITRDLIADLEVASGQLGGMNRAYGERLKSIAAALSAYLPPESD